MASAEPKASRHRRVVLAVGLAAGAAVAGVLYAARAWPLLNDVTTDVDDPPPFVALFPLRAQAGAATAYPGPATARAQQAAYPDVRPLAVAKPPEAAFAAALDAARHLGWTIVAEEPATGRIEAIATTRLLRFNDDVVIRIRPAASGSTVDVRSASRVGRGDLGANARRIRAFAARMAGRAG